MVYFRYVRHLRSLGVIGSDPSNSSQSRVQEAPVQSQASWRQTPNEVGSHELCLGHLHRRCTPVIAVKCGHHLLGYDHDLSLPGVEVS
jgi:hypothetical protein